MPFKTEWPPETQEEVETWISELNRQGSANVRASLASRWGGDPRALVPIGGFWMLRGFVQDWLAAHQKREHRTRELTFWLAALTALVAVLAILTVNWEWISVWLAGR